MLNPPGLSGEPITNTQNFESNNPLVHVLYDVSTRFYFSYKTLIEFCRNCCCKIENKRQMLYETLFW